MDNSSFELKKNFNNIKILRDSVLNLLTNLDTKVTRLKSIYAELMKTTIQDNNSSLDSFHFQTKLIMLELENSNTIFTIIDNRIYGDYYKLYKY